MKENAMITLYAVGPMFGQPDPSPFVGKAMMLLKMSKLPFEVKPMRFSKAPKGKVPYIEVGGGFLGDSHFIKCHLETQHGVDLGGGYGPVDRAKGWAIARMLEEHFYFLIVHDRWVPDDNFKTGPALFFNTVPLPLRGFIRSMIRSSVRKMLKGQGMSRHSDAERLQLARGDIDAVETLLGQKTYILGETISEYDATVFAFLFAAAATVFNSAMGADIRARPALMAYLERIRAAYFPECKL
jgi:glutathione S-transferase